MQKRYKAIAKDDLELFPHTWRKGLDYEVVENGKRLTLATDQGDTSWDPSKKAELSSVFDFLECEGDETECPH